MLPSDRRLRAFVFLFFFLVLLRNTWLCEDAFITYRVVDNLAQGLGLRWNPLERVQVYTHPLWMLCLSVVYLVSHDVYFSAVSLSLVFSGVAVWLVLSRGMTNNVQILLAGIVLTFSKAFVDFSTGGLENPLSHLLLVVFFLEYLKPEEERRFWLMVLCAGLGLWARMDHIWFFAPALAHLSYLHGYWRLRHLRLWAGLLPFVGWEVFSVIYYGFPFPNSAYAKLGQAIPAWKVLAQGVSYLINSLAWDPITLFATVSLVALAIARRREDRRMLVLAVSVGAYFVYLLRIGGDYMSGRFLAAPLLVSVLVLSRVKLEAPLETVATFAMLLGVGFSGLRPPLLTSDQYVGLGSSVQSVDDERGYRHDDTSLLKFNKDHGLRNRGGWVADAHSARNSGAKVRVFKNIGYYGFFAGPGLHVIDPYGIGDPLVARMPFTDSMGHWSSGHFYHQIPDGYAEAAIDEGKIKDPKVQAYWEKLKLVTRGPVFDRQRLIEVVKFNVGMNPVPAG
jgi:arabinofuranosyltransferase